MLPLLLALVLFPAQSTSAQDATPAVAPAPPLLAYTDLSARLHALVAQHANVAALFPLAKSREGRMLEVVRLSPGDPPAGRPAILVVANIDGPQVFTSSLAVALAERVAAGYPNDAKIKSFLDSTTLYVLPRANPDAAEARFAKPLFERETGGYGVDNDRDRREGEDPPADVDGDGRITQMRWLDPEGEWIVSPTDARAMVKADAKKGERGLYKLTVEGRDSDGDERVAEDPAADTVLNQNFPYEWKEHGENAGRFPLDEPESRALVEFVIAHKDIALVVTYGTLDNLVDKPKSVAADAPPQKRVPQAGVLQPDADLLAEIAKRYGEITGAKTKGRGTESGAFQAWCYQHRGLFSLAISPWDIPVDDAKKGDDAKKDGDKTAEKPAEKPAAGEGAKPPDAKAESKPEAKPDAPSDKKPDARSDGKSDAKKDKPTPTDDAKRLTWIDSSNESARFVAWHAFEHPELGSVEIGGFAPFARCEPPESERGEIAQKQIDFVLAIGPMLARVELATCKAKPLGADLVELEAAVTDSSLLPPFSASARRTQTLRPARVRLVLPDGATLLAGQPRELVRDLGGSGGRAELRWLVRTDHPGDLRVEVDTDQAGVASSGFEVKR